MYYIALVIYTYFENVYFGDKMLSSTKFYLELNSEKIEKRVKCYVKLKGIKKYITFNTSVKVNESYWDKENQRVRKRHVNQLIINNVLDKIYFNIQRTAMKIEDEKPDADFDFYKTEILKNINGRISKSKNLYEVFDEFLENRKSEIAKNTFSKFKTVKNHLREFEKIRNFRIDFSTLDITFFDKFKRYLMIEKNCTSNTVAKNLDFLRTFLAWAEKREHNVNPIYKEFKVATTEVDITFINEDELLLLENFTSEDNNLMNTRNFFLFSIYSGQRYSELVNFKYSDIKIQMNGVNRKVFWHVRQQKTRELVHIPLIERAQVIADKYKDEGKFPIPKSSVYNQFLKELCKNAGINSKITITKYKGSERIEMTRPKYEFISSHTGRRTFANLSLQRGMLQKEIMPITGHRTLEAFMKYVKVTADVMNNSMNRAWV
jgi:integrase